ncbi:TetR family transcriptional regulator [Acrocarpospora sp. B8E8]|uniref:TetR/AcrR family transcriptional regulator n=1 Tax=Acrocarpospora sp. B8E8 TaxID=3153572 RepID=UPI00325C6828
MAPGPPRLRRDAQRNYDALVAAARDAFAEHGLEASLEQVAKRAGVAIGTLYRHFPTRGHLVSAIFSEKLQASVAAAEQALAMKDTWAAFCMLLEKLCELQADDRGFNDLTSADPYAIDDIACMQTRVRDLGTQLLRRGQREKVIRPDLTPEDLHLLIWSQSRIMEATSGIAPHAWRRHLHLLIDAYRADRAHPIPEAPLTPQQLSRAMARLCDPARRQ